jgi:hypothetical protein
MAKWLLPAAVSAAPLSLTAEADAMQLSQDQQTKTLASVRDKVASLRPNPVLVAWKRLAWLFCTWA